MRELVLVALLAAIVVHLNPVDAGCACSVYGDPHVMMCDGKTNFDFQVAGQFQLLKTENIEVQCQMTRPAAGDYTEVNLCFVSVKSNGCEFTMQTGGMNPQGGTPFKAYGQAVNGQQLMDLASQAPASMNLKVAVNNPNSVVVTVMSPSDGQIELRFDTQTFTVNAPNLKTCSGICGTCSGAQQKPNDITSYGKVLACGTGGGGGNEIQPIGNGNKCSKDGPAPTPAPTTAAASSAPKASPTPAPTTAAASTSAPTPAPSSGAKPSSAPSPTTGSAATSAPTSKPSTAPGSTATPAPTSASATSAPSSGPGSSAPTTAPASKPTNGTSSAPSYAPATKAPATAASNSSAAATTAPRASGNSTTAPSTKAPASNSSSSTAAPSANTTASFPAFAPCDSAKVVGHPAFESEEVMQQCLTECLCGQHPDTMKTNPVFGTFVENCMYDRSLGPGAAKISLQTMKNAQNFLQMTMGSSSGGNGGSSGSNGGSSGGNGGSSGGNGGSSGGNGGSSGGNGGSSGGNGGSSGSSSGGNGGSSGGNSGSSGGNGGSSGGNGGSSGGNGGSSGGNGGSSGGNGGSSGGSSSGSSPTPSRSPSSSSSGSSASGGSSGSSGSSPSTGSSSSGGSSSSSGLSSSGGSSSSSGSPAGGSSSGGSASGGSSSGGSAASSGGSTSGGSSSGGSTSGGSSSGGSSSSGYSSSGGSSSSSSTSGSPSPSPAARSSGGSEFLDFTKFNTSGLEQPTVTKAPHEIPLGEGVTFQLILTAPSMPSVILEPYLQPRSKVFSGPNLAPSQIPREQLQYPDGLSGAINPILAEQLKKTKAPTAQDKQAMTTAPIAPGTSSPYEPTDMAIASKKIAQAFLSNTIPQLANRVRAGQEPEVATLLASGYKAPSIGISVDEARTLCLQSPSVTAQ